MDGEPAADNEKGHIDRVGKAHRYTEYRRTRQRTAIAT
jgi:hypothetical protein